MTSTAGHSFYIGPIGSFYNQVNDTGSSEPLVIIIIIIILLSFFPWHMNLSMADLRN